MSIPFLQNRKRFPPDSRGGIVARMSERFYVNCPLQPGPVTVEGPEAHHLAAVCRAHAGDLVCLFNGDGQEYPAKVVQVDRHSVEVDVQSAEAPQRELGFALEVAVALPKGDRAQFLVEKLTELGATSLVPLRTSRSVVHPRETKLEKLQRWVIEASKQCGRNVLLQVQPLAEWADYCRQADLPAMRLLADPVGPPFRRDPQENASLAVAVGPEGGFAEDEVQMAVAAGWRTLSLGPRILRVETAAMVLAGLVST